eukprot:Ihof_evm1s540 gene=Ihof_evmTU1s540
MNLLENVSANKGPCVDGIPFIYNYFGECIHTSKDVASFIIGLSSIGFWLGAQTPQLIKNFRNGSADAISIVFLSYWLLGDGLNLIGAIMTNQMATQIFTAHYFVSMDILLVLQASYYKMKAYLKARHLAGHAPKPMRENEITTLKCVGLYLATSGLLMSLYNQSNADFIVTPGTSRLLQSISSSPFFKNQTEQIGYIIGIASTLCYLVSRLPQIYRNYKRQSTGGLALVMFLLAMMGNVTYSLSIFIKSLESKFLLHRLPWIIG